MQNVFEWILFYVINFLFRFMIFGIALRNLKILDIKAINLQERIDDLSKVLMNYNEC